MRFHHIALMALSAAASFAPHTDTGGFAEYPKMLVKQDQERIVSDPQDEAAAIAEGFEFKGATSVPDVVLDDAAKLKADLDAAEELITKLDEAGARVTKERDDALKALDEAKSEIESLKADLAKADTAEKAERESLKADLAKLNIQFAKNASLDTLRRLLDEATQPTPQQ